MKDTPNIHVRVDNDGLVRLGTGQSHACSRIYYKTTVEWNSVPSMVAREGVIYIYSDYKQDEEGRNIAGFKVGDGKAYLIDMPFIDEIISEHVEEAVIHITQEEREFWNSKVRCYMSEVHDEELIFTTN